MDELILHTKAEEPTAKGGCVVRISAANAASVRSLAHKPRQSDKEIVDTLVAFALAHVKLVPEPLYSIAMRDSAEG